MSEGIIFMLIFGGGLASLAFIQEAAALVRRMFK